jgi:anti-sigma B factor antagonist
MCIVGIELSHNAAEVESHLPHLDRGRKPSTARLKMALLPEQSNGRAGGADGGNGMKTAVFSRWRTNPTVEDTRLETGDITVHVMPASHHITVAVAGRVTVDSSPHLRSALLGLLRRKAAPVILIELSGVSYLDMSGLATLLEALKAAREHSMKLRVTGISGKARTLAELAQLDTIFRTWGSEVEFC